MTEAQALRAENQRLAAALVESEIRNNLVLEATNDGVWDWDLTTDRTFFSSRWKAILGYEDHEVEHNSEAFFELIHEQDRPRVEAALASHFESRQPYLVEFRMRTKGGGWREIQARGQGMWNDEGKPIRMAGIHTDITERRMHESERLRNEELIEIQTETIRALGVPILQVWRGILCLPIIGQVDDERANEMTAELLDRVAATATRFAVLDLTGAQFRSETVQYLARMTRALRLIGTQGVFCGISSNTARILVDMQLDLGGVPTYRDLGDALRACLLRLRETPS
ncbi:PAS domain-containing protein [Enhygromyxa salina]|uniref:Blue-light photoreceptor n=1 Tax=Enhygromyxa salina TaxID=215803 RepID=A0A2S9XQN2_9BACT|nr:PAS domain-containing protein [Enhygromyxa salina]PRP95177.1 Blue-light photoreceptor [Enhygromyxa salina]